MRMAFIKLGSNVILCLKATCFICHSFNNSLAIYHEVVGIHKCIVCIGHITSAMDSIFDEFDVSSGLRVVYGNKKSCLMQSDLIGLFFNCLSHKYAFFLTLLTYVCIDQH